MSHFTNTAYEHFFFQSQPLNSNFNYNPAYPAYYYDPRLFGHPHEVAPQQFTEPFAYQYPPWTQPNQGLYYSPNFNQYFQHPLHANYTMDTQVLKIGTKFNNAGKDAKKGVDRPKPRPQEMVEVFVGETLIKQMPLRTITRFSSLASETFPRPPKEQEKKVATGNGESEGEEVNKDWADAKGGKVDVNKLAKQVQDLPLTTGGETEGASNSGSTNGGKTATAMVKVSSHMAHKGPEAHKSAKTSTTPIKRILTLGEPNLVAPTAAAVRTCLDWMTTNSTVHGDMKLGVFLIPKNAAVTSLVNVYAAAMCLGMRPFPRNLEEVLKQIVTDEPPKATMLQYFYERLPDSSVLTRIITSCVQHSEQGQYEAVEYEAIDAYVGANEWLYDRFAEIQASRVRRRRENGAKRAMQRDWAELEKEAGAEEAGLGVRYTGVGQQGSGPSKDGTAQAPRRQQNAKGKGKSGTGKGEKSGEAVTEKASEKVKIKPERYLEAERKAEEAAAKLKGQAKK